jgi:hypothetical protein
MSVTITSQTPFSIHAAAYRIARDAYEKHRDQCQAPLAQHDPLQRDYEDAYQPLVDAMTDSGVNAVRCPVSTSAELAQKIEIFAREEMEDYEGSKELIAIILADAKRIGGVA